MAKYESGIKQVPHSQSAVYGKISDLSNLAAIKEKLNDPDQQEKLKGQIPADKWDEVKKHLEEMECTSDTLSITAGPIGSIAIKIESREPEKCVKYVSTNSPVGFKLWIQVLPTGDDSCKLKVTIDADLNFFMKQMLDKHLQQGVDRFADMMAMIPY
ncbi:MAG: SRPBCC family protein [Prevotellaceae bacterium]|nr:SRPBCC family protein [Candidatus Minthosoma caballi]